MEKKIDSILKESGMTHEEFNEIKGITLAMKESGKLEVIETIHIVVAAPLVGVTITQPSVQEPYAVVVQVQPIRTRSDQPRRKSEVDTMVA